MTYEQADDCALQDGLVLSMRILPDAATPLVNVIENYTWLKKRLGEGYDVSIQRAREQIDAIVKREAKQNG